MDLDLVAALLFNARFGDVRNIIVRNYAAQLGYNKYMDFLGAAEYGKLVLYWLSQLHILFAVLLFDITIQCKSHRPPCPTNLIH